MALAVAAADGGLSGRELGYVRGWALSGLDLAARHRFLEILGKLAGLGKSLILVTHHLEEIIPAIDRVILLKEGRVFLDGPKAEVLRSDPVSRLFGVPVQVQRLGERYAATVP